MEIDSYDPVIPHTDRALDGRLGEFHRVDPPYSYD
jgi:hypothetical protein